MYTTTFLCSLEPMKAYSRAFLDTAVDYFLPVMRWPMIPLLYPLIPRTRMKLYFNHSRQSADKAAFEADLFELKTLLEAGTPVCELSEPAQAKVKKYFTVKNGAGGSQWFLITEPLQKPISIMVTLSLCPIRKRNHLNVCASTVKERQLNLSLKP